MCEPGTGSLLATQTGVQTGTRQIWESGLVALGGNTATHTPAEDAMLLALPPCAPLALNNLRAAYGVRAGQHVGRPRHLGKLTG